MDSHVAATLSKSPGQVSLTRVPRSAASLHGKLASIAWPLLLIMTLMLLLSVASISTLSALRAYVNGEGRWSKAEGQAIADLRRYSVTDEEGDYQRFLSQLAVPFGDRMARLELQTSHP